MANFKHLNANRATPLNPLTAYGVARAAAAKPSPATLRKREHDARAKGIKESLKLIDSVLHSCRAPKKGSIAKTHGKKSPPVGAGELLIAALMQRGKL